MHAMPSMVPNWRPLFRRERLKLAFPEAMSLIRRDRASRVESGFIADYLALNWLVRTATSFQITPAGTSVCHQLKGSPG